MVVKNKINLDQQSYKIQEDVENLEYEISTIIQQTPDRSFLRGIRQSIYHANDTLSIRYAYNQKVGAIVPDTLLRVPNRFRRWVRDKLGKRPVVLDTMLAEESARSMRNFLHQKAYFDAKVSYSIDTSDYKAVVNYHIETGMPILIDTVSFYSQDSTIQQILEQLHTKTTLKVGNPLSLERLRQEKERIALAIRNRGYYYFSVSSIQIEADTANARDVAPSGKRGLFGPPLEQGEPRANVYVEVLPYSDTVIIHPRYRIKNVYITPNEVILKAHQRRIIQKDSFFVVERTLHDRYRRIILQPDEAEEPNDVILRTWTTPKGKVLRLVKRSKPRVKKLTFTSRKDLQPEDNIVHIILRKAMINPDGTPGTDQQRRQKFYIRDKVISDAVTVQSGDYYSYQDTRETIRRIDKLNVFRLPRIECLPSELEENCLDCIVRMQPGKKQEIGADFDLNNNETTVSSLGIATYLNYQNKNIFKGAEIFDITAFGGIDFKIGSQDSLDDGFFEQAVNLLDISLETSLYFPRFLGFNFLENALKMERPRTRLTVGYRYLQQSTDFLISSFYAKMVYEWSRGPQHAFTWNPMVLNLTPRPVLDPDFEQLLLDNNRALYESLSASFLIPSTDFTYAFTSLKAPYGGSWSFRTTFELAGNLFYLLDQVVQPEERMQFGGVDYSQYFSTDVDIRYSYQINTRNSIISRLMLGVIVPYGNSIHTEVPFVKRFTLGGPSSMRAWNLRYLGPGNKPSINGAEFQLGDVRLEFNSEYRFKINSWLGAAVFADIGNVWLLEAKKIPQELPYETPKSGVFTSKFYEQLAIGAGVGLRLDLSFFVLRFDYAFQLREPQGYGLRENGTVQYWNDQIFKEGRRKFIIAIGYPF